MSKDLLEHLSDRQILRDIIAARNNLGSVGKINLRIVEPNES